MSIPHDQEFVEALLDGLKGDKKSIPCRYLYDARGSELFEGITRQPEYYPTRTEAAILEECAPMIAASLPEAPVLLEFGSGSSLKTEILLDAIAAKLTAYIPLDISPAALEEARDRLARRYPDLNIEPITADFHEPVRIPDRYTGNPHIGFFPGSTIGNLLPDEAVHLLESFHETLRPDGRLIIGTDLQKPLEVLLPAYNDAAGVTADFNLNVLRHANAAAGSDFDMEKFEHVAVWNDERARIEMHLVSKTDHTVTIGGQRVRFRQGEHLHTENSHKYTIEGFHDLVARAGWKPVRVWTDDNDYFAVHDLVSQRHD